MNPEAKLRREGLPEEAVAAFRALYDQLVAGASGTLPDAELEPVRELPTLAQLPRPAALDASAARVRDQAQRRARDEHGARRAEVAASRPATG